MESPAPGQAATERTSGWPLELTSADLESWPVHHDALALIPEVYARENQLLALAVREDTLLIACADPADSRLLQDVQLLTRRQVTAARCAPADLRKAISERYRAAIDSDVLEFNRVVEASPRRAAAGTVASASSPIVQVVDKIIAQGLRDRASDIHVEPQRSALRIRFRIDGLLQDAITLPKEMSAPIASRLKVMANLDIVDRHRSQDGQIRIEGSDRQVDVRVSTAETIWGEKIVLRLLDQSRTILKLDSLGLSVHAMSRVSQLLVSPFGMVVVSGPTGSGKTTTLYAAINELDPITQNITTIEDPVEYTFDNINQMQIRKVANLTFANGLRAILRQDPDVLLVGEIRDLETAEIAIQSALTGHLVLTSLHATDAAAVIQRFIEMGIEGYLVSSALIGVVAQRLVRRICSTCSTPYELSAEEASLWKELGSSSKTIFYRGAGCELCARTGYRGRIGVFEVLPLSDQIKRLVSQRAPAEAVRQQASREGMVRLREAAIEKVAADATTLSEVIRCVWAS